MSLKAGGNRSKPGGGNTAGAPSSGAGGSGGGRQNLGRSVTIKTLFYRTKMRLWCNIDSFQSTYIVISNRIIFER